MSNPITNNQSLNIIDKAILVFDKMAAAPNDALDEHHMSMDLRTARNHIANMLSCSPPLLACPVCGGEAMHAQKMLARTMILPDTTSVKIDVALNGVDAAPQAKLCDIAAQVGKAAREFGPILQVLGAPPEPVGAHSGDWAIAAAFREVTGPNGGLIKNDEVVDFISTRARELIANARPPGAVPLPAVIAFWKTAESQSEQVLTDTFIFPVNDYPKPIGYECVCTLADAIRYGNERESAGRAVWGWPEGWKITRNEVGGIHVEGPEGWMSMPDTTPKNGNFSLEMRLLYGLAEALLDSPKSQFSEMKNFVRDWLSLPMGGYLKNADFGTPIAEFSLNTSPNQLVTDQASDEAAQDREPASASPRRVHAVRYGMDLKPCHCDAGKDHVAGAEVYSGMVDASHGADHAVSDTTAALIDMLRQRDATGLIKYGKTLDRTDLTHAEWLQHMAEEMLDGAGYALAALRTMKAELYEDTDGDLYLDLGGRGTNGERFMRRYANDDRDWVSAGEFALLTPFNPSTPQQNEQEKP